MERILITGGAGFVGAHLARTLLERGHHVRVLDSLEPPRHPPESAVRLATGVDFVCGDVRDEEAVERALSGVDVVYHLAARTSVPESMDRCAYYVDHNVRGAATILRKCRNRVRRFILASSRAVYGEGAAICERCGPTAFQARRVEDLDAHNWEPSCRACGASAGVKPAACREEMVLPRPVSIYGLTKRQQEGLVDVLLADTQTESVTLRYFNVFGEGQSPVPGEVGVLAIFVRNLLDGRPIELYEGGLQTRDFVHVSDVTRANIMALSAPGGSYNVGSGRRVSLKDICSMLGGFLGSAAGVELTSTYRRGDVRHALASTNLARTSLGWTAQVSLEEGLERFVDWMASSKTPI